jgi:hypothetical protein
LFDSKYENVPLAEPLAPNGTMILSGIIEEREHVVVDAVSRHGLAIVHREQEGDWVALFVRRTQAQTQSQAVSQASSQTESA